MSASELEKLALCERERACDPAIHLPVRANG